MLVLVGLCSSFAGAEEKAKPPMMKQAMAARKMMMPESMVPGMVAKEMVHQEIRLEFRGPGTIRFDLTLSSQLLLPARIGRSRHILD